MDIKWVPISDDDMPEMETIGKKYFPDFPERIETFREKIRIGNGFCFKILRETDESRMLGYGVSHPFIKGKVPPLDSFSHEWNVDKSKFDAIHMHDFCLEAECRGFRLSNEYISIVEARAIELGFKTTQLVAVHGTSKLWEPLGYRKTFTPDVSLATYGDGSVFMSKELI